MKQSRSSYALAHQSTGSRQHLDDGENTDSDVSGRSSNSAGEEETGLSPGLLNQLLHRLLTVGDTPPTSAAAAAAVDDRRTSSGTLTGSDDNQWRTSPNARTTCKRIMLGKQAYKIALFTCGFS